MKTFLIIIIIALSNFLVYIYARSKNLEENIKLLNNVSEILEYHKEKIKKLENDIFNLNIEISKLKELKKNNVNNKGET